MTGPPPKPATCRCPAGAPLAPFYDAAAVPVTTTPPAPRAALDARYRRISLAACPACGIIRNLGGPSASESPIPLPHAEHPDMLHTLREGAFWDLSGDAATCFTPGSLARQLRSAGFDVRDLRRSTDGQSFTLHATPAGRPTAMRFELEDDLAAIADAVAGFDAAVHRQLTRWRRIIDDSAAEGQRIVIWGAGPKSVGFLATLRIPVAQIPRVVDPAPDAANAFLPYTAQPIVPPASLRADPPDVLIVPDSRHRDAAQRHLRALKLQPTLLVL